MNYKEQYDQLISYRLLNKLEKSKEQAGMIESHHILPRCCGGTDDPENLVNLYAKEHFMAHYYLWKMHENDEFKYPLLNAFWLMCIMSSASNERSYQEYVKMSEEYQEARIQFAKQLSETMPDKVSGSKNGQFGKHWYYDPLTNESHQYVDGQQPSGWILGRKYKDIETFKLKSNANKNRKWIIRIDMTEQKLVDEQYAKNLVESGLWKYRHTQKPMSEDARLRIKIAHSNINVSDEFKYSAKNKEAYIKGKIRYINLKTNQIKYFSKDEKIPDDFVSTQLLNKKLLMRVKSKQEKHNAWLKETQKMADYYVQYGYEATCKKFNVHMSVESMLMRFCRARKKYGIRFESDNYAQLKTEHLLRSSFIDLFSTSK